MRKIALLCLILLPLISPAQEESSKRYVHKGLLSGDASIAPGMLLKQNVSTVSIPGTLEYFWDEHVSIKADIYYQANAGLTNDSLRLIANHQLFVGINYHIHTNSNFDPYLGFQPGVAYGQVRPESKLPFQEQTPYGQVQYNASLAPVLGLSIGFNYYFFRYFHIFVEARYVHGTLLYNAPGSFSLDELKCQFGLGWNLNLLHQKKSS
jgi:hypothetical protein